MDDNTLGQLSNQIGAEPQQTAVATRGILNTLVNALARNASTPEGAANLNNALERDHDGGIFDQLSGFLGGNAQVANPRTANGAGILEHILGGQQSGAVDMISKVSGLSGGQTGSLMEKLAPVVMGMLGKQKQQGGLDIGSLVGMLSGTVQQQKQSGSPLMDLANRFLDKDGDGSALDDVASMVGGKLLGGLFGRR